MKSNQIEDNNAQYMVGRRTLVLLIPALLIVALLISYVHVSWLDAQKRQLNHLGTSMAKEAAAFAAIPIDENKEDVLQQMVDGIASNPFVVDAIVYFNNAQNTVESEDAQSTLTHIMQARTEKKQKNASNYTPFVEKIYLNDLEIGWIRITLDKKQLNRRTELSRRSSLFIIVFLLLIGASISYYLGRQKYLEVKSTTRTRKKLAVHATNFELNIRPSADLLPFISDDVAELGYVANNTLSALYVVVEWERLMPHEELQKLGNTISFFHGTALLKSPFGMVVLFTSEKPEDLHSHTFSFIRTLQLAAKNSSGGLPLFKAAISSSIDAHTALKHASRLCRQCDFGQLMVSQRLFNVLTLKQFEYSVRTSDAAADIYVIHKLNPTLESLALRQCNHLLNMD